MNPLHALSRSLLSALFAVGAWSACSAEPSGQPGNLPATGGASGSGGAALSMGGSPSDGPTGGVAPSTGGVTTGGTTAATGGTVTSGSAGMATAGTLGSAGSSAGSGSSSGGTSSGGDGSATAGSTASGGATGAGGRGSSGGNSSGGSSGSKATGGSASGGGASGGGATGGSAGASTCNLPVTVSFQKDVQPFLITACGGGNGCHVVDASSTTSSGGYNHAYDWLTGGAHTSSCPTGPMRFQIVLDVINAANPATCSKSRKMPPPDASGAGLRAPLTRCQVETLQAWLNEPLVTQTHRADDSSPTTPYPMPPFN